MRIVTIVARDGVELAAAVYAPAGDGPFPALLAASPYRFDNNELPVSRQFLWRETGPIELYVERGYVYVDLDVRGCGRSGGEFGFLDRNEQNDCYDVVEWIAAQPWCTGAVGGIGQSYFCMLQWFMAALRPPALKCIAAHDGLNDPYRANVYNGGIFGDFFPGYWWHQNRVINRHPANGGPAREQATDLDALLAAHPLYDDFWRERSAWEVLDRIDVPLYSSGVWGKHIIHTRGNIEGFRKASGPKKLRVSGAPNAWAAAAEFASRAFHERVLLPFYDHYLKGLATDYLDRPPVEYAVLGTGITRTADTWPPPSVFYDRWYLNARSSGSVDSLNDGGLTHEPGATGGATSYSYPDPGWVSGVVGFGPGGPAAGFDPARRVLTFTSPPLERDVEIAGPIKLELYASSTATDTDFFVKLSDQFPQADAARASGANPRAETVSRGWLRASHRALDPARSTEMEPYHPHDATEPLVPGSVERFDISLEPMAYRFAAGHRIRFEIVNGDSPQTEALWTHFYRPDKIGTDTIVHDADHPSVLILPIDGAH
jgi:putative CocE/NonD family hydrolase